MNGTLRASTLQQDSNKNIVWEIILRCDARATAKLFKEYNSQERFKNGTQKDEDRKGVLVLILRMNILHRLSNYGDSAKCVWSIAYTPHPPSH